MVQVSVQLKYANYKLDKELHSLLALHWCYNSICVISAEFTGITMTLYERYYYMCNSIFYNIMRNNSNSFTGTSIVLHGQHYL